MSEVINNTKYIPYLLGFLASTFQVIIWITHREFPEKYTLTNALIITWLISIFEAIVLLSAVYTAKFNNINLDLFRIYRLTCFYIGIILFDIFFMNGTFNANYVIAFFLLVLSAWFII